MDKSEQVWNIILYYSKPLTDDQDSETVIMGSDIRDMHNDIVALIEGKEVGHYKVSELPEPKKKEKKEKPKEVEPVLPAGEPIPGHLQEAPTQWKVEEKKPWWKVW